MTRLAYAELVSALGALSLGAGGLLYFALSSVSDQESDREWVLLLIGAYVVVLATALLGAFLHAKRSWAGGRACITRHSVPCS